jgi:hypothetical protein
VSDGATLNDHLDLERTPAGDEDEGPEYGELSLKISDSKLREWSVSMPYPPEDLPLDDAIVRLRRALKILVHGNDDGERPAGADA